MCGKGELEATAESDGGDSGDGRDGKGGNVGEGGSEKRQKGLGPAERKIISWDTLLPAWKTATTHSSGENPLRSFKSAPAQKELSTALATISALVGPFSSAPATPPNRLFQLLAGSSSPVDASYCEWTASTSLRSV